jgi:hypothetical protein
VSRIFNLVLILAMLAGALVTYDMKHKAEMAADHVATLRSQIAKEKDQIALLKAEWSVLDQPARLQGVVDKYADHFKLQPFSPTQIASIDQIPMRPADAPAIPVKDSDPLGQILTELEANAPGGAQ